MIPASIPLSKEENFTGLKLIVMCPNHFLNIPKSGHVMCQLNYYENGEQQLIYTVSFGSPEREKTQQEKNESFNKIYNQYKKSWYLAAVELYNPDITSQQVQDFIKDFEKRRGVSQTRDFSTVINNCASAVRETIHHFFKNYYTHHIYQLIYLAFHLQEYRKMSLVSGVKTTVSAIFFNNLIMGGIGFLAPGFSSTLPTLPASTPHDAMLEARIHSLFGYDEPSRSSNIERAKTAIQRVGNSMEVMTFAMRIFLAYTPLARVTFLLNIPPALFIASIIRKTFTGTLECYQYSAKKIAEMEKAFYLVTGLATLIVVPSFGFLSALLIGLALPKNTAIAMAMCFSASIHFYRQPENILIVFIIELSQMLAAFTHELVKTALTTPIATSAADKIDGLLGQALTTVGEPVAGVLGTYARSFVNHVTHHETKLGRATSAIVSCAVEGLWGAAQRLQKSKLNQKVAESSFGQLASAVFHIAGSTKTGAAFSNGVNRGYQFWATSTPPASSLPIEAPPSPVIAV